MSSIELKHTQEMGEIRDRLNRLEKIVDALKSTESYPYSPQPPETHQRASYED